MGVDEAYNFRQVDETFSTAGVLGESQLAALAREGYTAVINLLPQDSEYAVTSERALVLGQGLEYRQVPVDFGDPRPGDYQAFEHALRELAGGRVMIHCAANYRASAFFALYARRNLGWSDAQAKAFIADVWDPREHAPWNAFIAGIVPGMAEGS